MSPAAAGAWAVVVAAAAAGFAVTAPGCFRPSIDDGGFACSSIDEACPQGFSCASNGRCYRDPSVVVVDAGSETTCSVPPVAPSCQDEPRTGEVCNPACQKGCACGRCNVVSTGHAACVPSGTVKLGDVCKPGNADDCAPGLICLKEACGNNLGRCYRHCASNAQCDGTICQIPILDSNGQDTGFKTCDIATRACDPVNNTGCPSSALNCYLTSANLTLCDCPGAPPDGKNGDPCTIYNDCAPGYVCVAGVGGVAEPRCRFACAVSAANACPTGSCVPAGTGAKYGYCGD